MIIKAMVMILSSAPKDSSVPNPLKDGFFLGSYGNHLAFGSIPQRIGSPITLSSLTSEES